MAKIRRDMLLSRGAKLTKQHIEGAVGAVAVKLSNVGIDRDNLRLKNGITRFTWTIPVLDSAFFRYAAGGRTVFAIPLPIVPFQENYDLFGRQTTTTPQNLTLDEFSLSFDMRDEAGAICDRYQGAGAETGKLNWSGLDAYTMHVSLDEKAWTVHSPNEAIAAVNLFSMELGPQRLAGRTFRDNPFSLTGLNKTLRPYRTYVLSIVCPQLYDAVTGNRSALVSLTISMRCRAPLVKRDAFTLTGMDIQNQPSPWVGDKTADTVAQTAIAGDDPITEARIQGNLQAVDAAFQKKLVGGLPTEGIPAPVEHLMDDSCYECIVVPLCGNVQEGMITAADALGLPYVGVAPCKSAWVDRRHIPILEPFVLHHVIIANNRMGPRLDGMAAAAVEPASLNLRWKVGVAVLEGLRADDFAYQQVAKKEWSIPAGAMPALPLDELQVCENAQHGGWQLLECSLLGAGGNSYYGQGKPIYIGKTNIAGSARTNINGGASATVGRETLIEVAWEIKNTVDGLAQVADGGVEVGTALYSGYGGNFVYLIGKKSLAGDPTDVPC